jgi:hypothetical protein
MNSEDIPTAPLVQKLETIITALPNQPTSVYYFSHRLGEQVQQRFPFAISPSEYAFEGYTLISDFATHAALYQQTPKQFTKHLVDAFDNVSRVVCPESFYNDMHAYVQRVRAKELQRR